MNEENNKRRLSRIKLRKKEEETKTTKIILNIVLPLTFILMLIYLILSIINTNNITNNLPTIIGISILLIFCIFFIITGMFIKSKKSKIFIIISSILLSIFSIFNIINIINTDSSKVIDFTNMNIKDVIEWGEDNNIYIDEVYEPNNNIEKDLVFKQSVKVDTPIKDVDKIIVTVSNGPSNKTETKIPNMIGWNLDKVLKFINDNKLSNVTIDFEYNNDIDKDIVFKQSTTNTIKSDDELKLVVSLGNKDDIKDVKMINLIEENTFNATIWLKRNSINYEIEYSLSNKYNEGTIIGQSIKENKIFSPLNTTVVITVASKSKVTIPDLKNMSVTEIDKWANVNKINVYYEEEYSEDVDKGKVILNESNKGYIIKPNETMKLTISKGCLKMIKYTTLEEFIKWADNNEVRYSVDYEFSDSIDSGKLISISHEENDIVKSNETIKILISQGSTVTVPNLVGKTKTEIDEICSNTKIKCVFIYETNKDVDKDICTKQSMRKDSKVPVNTSITITISK